MKYFPFFVPLFWVGFAFGQNTGVHEFDLKSFNLGFQIGINYSTYNLQERILVKDSKSPILLEQIQMKPSAGLKLAIINNLNLHNNFSLRLIPAVSLEQRSFDFFFENNKVEQRKVEATYFNVPLLLQFKSDYYNRIRIYVLGGGQYGLNFSSTKRVRDDVRLLKISKHDYSIVLGAGINLYGDKIKLSPEITYTLGVENIFNPEFTTHSDAIKSLKSRVISVILNFE